MSAGRAPRPPERRAHARARAALGASYEDASGQLFLRTGDLSVGGVFLEARELPPLGSPAQVVLEVPGDPAIHRFTGRVTRHQDAPERGFAVAFDAARLPWATREAVQRFVAAAVSGPGRGD